MYAKIDPTIDDFDEKNIKVEVKAREGDIPQKVKDKDDDMDDEEMFNNHDMKIQNMLRIGGRGSYYVVEDVI